MALSLYAVIHTYFLQPNACLTYYSCADTCVRALESAQPSAALPPKFKSLLRGYLQVTACGVVFGTYFSHLTCVLL